MAERQHDLVLVGATGFVGRLTAEYLQRTAPADCRWAIAGRSETKLKQLSEDLGLDVPVVVADTGDPAAVRELAESTSVVVTTVGPYSQFGDPLVAACAEAGTDYLDLTGEPEFVDRTYLRHHARAQDTGARLVHCCGFDSVPHDVGAYFTVRQLPEDVPLRVSGYVQASATFSGGTFQSALGAFADGRGMLAAARERARVEGRSPRSRPVTGRPHRAIGLWAMPLPTIDAQVVARSGAAVERYGPDFRYSHYAGFAHPWTAAGAAVGAGALLGAAQIGPVRRFLAGRAPAGTGPSAEKRERSWFRVSFVGTGGGVTVRTRVSGGDPGYGETAVMLGECALAMAFDDLPITAGQVTPVAAMGDSLLERLPAAGLKFEVLQPA